MQKDPARLGANSVLHPKTIIYSRIKTLPDFANRSVLHQKYIVEGHSAKQIAEQTGASKEGILHNLRRFDIPRREGKKPHGSLASPPYGFHIVNGKRVKNTKEQKVIQAMRRMRKEGLSFRAIARALTEVGVPTKRGKVAWQQFTIRMLLLKTDLPQAKKGV